MGFFNRNFDRPGPGVAKDAPRKKGAARWFEILGRDLGSFFKARSEEHTSELQSLHAISYAVFCLKKKK